MVGVCAMAIRLTCFTIVFLSAVSHALRLQQQQGASSRGPEDQDGALCWEKDVDARETAFDADHYDMAEGVGACYDLLLKQPQLLFAPDADVRTWGGDEEMEVEHLRPSCGKRVSPSSEMSLRERVQAAFNALRGRTLLMAGDSTMRHNFMIFACMLKIVDDPTVFATEDKKEALNTSLHATRGKGCPPQDKALSPKPWCMGFPDRNARIVYQWVQEGNMVSDGLAGALTSISYRRDRSFGAEFEALVHRNSQLLLDTAQDLRLVGDDMMLLNLGLGYNGLFVDTSGEWQRSISRLYNSSEFAESTAVLEKSLRISMTYVMKTANGTHLPRLAWRETLPQHYDTPQRMYVNHPLPTCVPMDDQAIRHGANVYNEVGNALMAELEVPVIPMWKALSKSNALHTGHGVGDCTHYNADANMWMVGQISDFVTEHLR